MIYYTAANIVIKHLEIEIMNNLTLSSKIKVIEGLELYCDDYIKAKSIEEVQTQFKRLFLDTLSKNTYETLYKYCDRKIFNEYVKIPFWQKIVNYVYKANDISFQFIIKECSALEALSIMSISELIDEIKDTIKDKEEQIND